MRPLRRTTGAREEHEAAAARLLARTAPTPPQPAMRRRVRARLDSPAAASRFRLPGWALSPAVILAVLMLATAAASATLGRGLIERLGLLPPASPAATPSAARVTSSRPASPHRDQATPLWATTPAPSLPAPAEPPSVEPQAAAPALVEAARPAPPASALGAATLAPARPLPASSTTPPASAIPPARPTVDPAPPAPQTPAPSPVPTSAPAAAARTASPDEDDVPSPTRVGLPAAVVTQARGPDDHLLTEAFHALQDDHDPRRALALAERYRIERPQGLDEEALIIALASCARLSDPCGPRYADTYLARYPEGRFAMEARRVLRTRSK